MHILKFKILEDDLSNYIGLLFIPCRGTLSKIHNSYFKYEVTPKPNQKQINYTYECTSKI